jgi:crossover junction endodeoxyribonuclease RuvC
MLICGIDPGLTGAWGMIDLHGKYWSCGDMHHDELGIIDSEKVWSEMAQARDSQDIVVAVERVGARPGQGVSSMFKFGMAFGTALNLAQRFKSRWVMVTPQVWKKGLKIDSDKKVSLDLARELFPLAPLSRVKDGGRAEALLIAEYFRRLHCNQNTQE